VIRHEALVNLALAEVPVSVLCPYDIRLGTELIASVECTHPELPRARSSARSMTAPYH
jgi:hypothetical protein